MTFLKRLFGKSEPAPSQPPESSKAEKRSFRIFDDYGRETVVSSEQWRATFLPRALTKHWNDADALYALISEAIQEGFARDVAPAARRIHEIDSNVARGATALAVVEMELGHLDAAESILRAALERVGEDGLVLTNLAKAFARKGDAKLAKETLWRALTAEPNQDSGLFFWMKLHREQGGQPAEQEALEQVAALPGSYRANVWLARSALARGDVARAVELFRLPLSLPSIPAEVLEQVSAGLGKAGKLNELVALVRPCYRPVQHGIGTGNNLLKAFVELGRFREARELLEQLYGFNRIDWRETLQYWEQLLDEKTRGFGALKGGVPPVSLLELAGCVWCHDEWFGSFVPAKASDARRIAVMVPSCTLRHPSQVPLTERTNLEGGLSRAVALALAESLHLETAVKGVCLVPLLGGAGDRSFVLSGAPWSIEQVRALVAPGREHYVATILLHLDASTEPWRMMVTVYGTAAQEPLLVQRAEVQMVPGNPGPAIEYAATMLTGIATRVSGAPAAQRPSWMGLPGGTGVASWLLATEQCLATLCADASTGPPAMRLYGERSIVDAMLAGCADNPGSIPWRMLLATTLTRLATVRPDVVGEYMQRVQTLMQRHPIRGEQGAAIGNCTRALGATVSSPRPR